MNYQQLIQPNLNVVGQDGLCLAYVTEVFGVPNYYPSATAAWQDAQFKHTDQPPTNISVPVWFNYNGPDGHVAVWANGVIHSTSAKGMQTFGGIQALINWMNEGFVYLGWSEDINKVRVVQPEGEEMPNEGDVVNAYAAVGETATAEDIAVYTSKAWNAGDGLYYGKTLVDLKNAQAYPPGVTPYSGPELFTKS
jgi:hypothetical protein